VNVSASISPAIFAEVAVLCLVGICGMFVLKRNGNKSSMEGSEMGCEAELRQDGIDRCDSESESDSDVDDDHSEEDENEDMIGDSKTVEADSMTKQPLDPFDTEEWFVGGVYMRTDIFAHMRVEEGYM
jgi:hypothetical protein